MYFPNRWNRDLRGLSMQSCCQPPEQPLRRSCFGSTVRTLPFLISGGDIVTYLLCFGVCCCVLVCGFNRQWLPHSVIVETSEKKTIHSLRIQIEKKLVLNSRKTTAACPGGPRIHLLFLGYETK